TSVPLLSNRAQVPAHPSPANRTKVTTRSKAPKRPNPAKAQTLPRATNRLEEIRSTTQTTADIAKVFPRPVVCPVVL
ncbi:hypothetical protein BGY98DRAFT_1006386, partial [Russula aff. rugulosa BPL654]